MAPLCHIIFGDLSRDSVLLEGTQKDGISGITRLWYYEIEGMNWVS